MFCATINWKQFIIFNKIKNKFKIVSNVLILKKKNSLNGKCAAYFAMVRFVNGSKRMQSAVLR